MLTLFLNPETLVFNCMSDKKLLKNMSWLTFISGIERLAAVLQTVLIARALGITEYGVYGLIFGTIGLTASVTGLQMGLTATVFVARYRDTEKSKAAFVIAFVNRFGLAVSLLFLLCTIPFASHITLWLVGSSGLEMAVVAGCLLVAFSIISGVQDGIIQGFEDFRSVALVRLITTVITLGCIYFAGIQFGLLGVMSALLLGLLVKYLLLTRKLIWHIRENKLPAKGDGVCGKELLWGFSFPSMLVSLLVGAVGWWGTFLLSRQTNGFDALAVVNTGLQWRGPIFLLSSAISSVAIPVISRYFQSENHIAIQEMQRKVLLFNGGFTLLASAVMILLSPWILLLYGSKFSDGTLVFSLVIASSVPQVIAGIYMQNLVAKGQMRRILLLHLWLVIPMCAGYQIAIPQYHSIGFAIVNLLVWTIFTIVLILTLKATSFLPNKQSLHENKTS